MDKHVYSSQPPPKKSTWIFQKWRCPKSSKSSSSTQIPQENQPDKRQDFEPNPRSVQTKRKWAIPDDESRNWSENYRDFYYNGDMPFCYFAAFINPIPLDHSFWGTLASSNAYLTTSHIEGWVGRLMQWGRREITDGGRRNMCWSIIPPLFSEHLLNSCNKNAVSFANGKFNPCFPPFWEVDYVLFPFCVQNQQWSLVRAELKTSDLVICVTENMTFDRYRRTWCPILQKLAVYMGALLVNSNYWKKSGQAEKQWMIGTNDDFVQPQDDLVYNESLYICMLMKHLVTGKPINKNGNFKESAKEYRSFMAEQFYFWRCLPRS